MEYTIEDVIPQPLNDVSFDSESIWRSSFSIAAPEFTLLKAASGTGKTTFLSILYGLRQDYTGNVSIDGKDLKQLHLKDWAELRQHKLAVVLQDLRLFPRLSARENIQLKLDLTHPFEMDEVEAMAEQLGVASKLDQKCQFLSLGQQQRFALIRALCQPFKLLLMDEPFSHIDTVNIEKACQLIQKQCNKNEAGMLLTTLGETYPLPFNKTLHI